MEGDSMSTEQKLKDYILSRYKSVLDFTKKADMPYSTIDSIFKRGIKNANVQTIIKLCDILSIQVEPLFNGEIIEKEHNKKSGIGEKFNKLLEDNGRNINEVATAINVSPQTLYSISKRNNTKVDLDVLQKIADELNVTLDYFVDGNSAGQKIHKLNDLVLSKEERGLIIAFREFSPDYKLKVIKFIDDIKAEIEKDKKLEMLIKQNEELMYGRAVAYGGETANVVLTPEANAKIDEYIRQEEEREDNDLL